MLLSRLMLLACAVCLSVVAVAMMGTAPPMHALGQAADVAGDSKRDGSAGTAPTRFVTEKPAQSIRMEAGMIADLVGSELHELGNAVWLLSDDLRVSLIVAPDEHTLMAYHNDRAEATIAKLKNISPQEAVSMLSGEGGGQIPNCGPGEHLCHCWADDTTEPQSCGGPVESWKCCPDGEFCSCKYVWDEFQTCVIGVQVVCLQDPS